MKDQARRYVIDEVVELATEHSNDLTLLDQNGRTLTERMTDALVGHLKSPNLDPGTSGRAPVEDLPDELRGSLGYSDRTGALGVQSATFGDRARDDQKANDRDLLSALRLLRAVRERSARYNARSANPVEREQTGRANEPGCESCSRLAGAHGEARWEPVAVDKAKVGDATMRLCRWCADHLRATGEVPTRAQVDAHHSGKRVSRSVA